MSIKNNGEINNSAVNASASPDPSATHEEPSAAIPTALFSPLPESAFEPNPFTFSATHEKIEAVTDLENHNLEQVASHPATAADQNDGPDPGIIILHKTQQPPSPIDAGLINDEWVVIESASVVEDSKISVGMAPARPKVTKQPSGTSKKDPTNGLVGHDRPKYERMYSGRMPVEYVDEDALDAVPAKRRYRIRDMLLTIWAIGSYIVDFVTDWLVAAAFYKDKDYVWFGLTVAFIVGPTLCMTCFSLAWYIQDHKNHPSHSISWKAWIVRIIVLSLQLAPVLRYIDSLRFGYRFRNSNPTTRMDLYESLCFENADASMLRLFEAFTEAAPQLVLQIYILVRKRNAFDRFDIVQCLQIISIFTSWFSLATAMASFHRAQRFSQQTKGSMSILGTIMQFFWHLFVFASRVIAIALFTVRFGFWGPVLCGCHVIIMIVWVFFMRTHFCPHRPLEICYNIAVGCLYLFAFLNVKDTPTRRKYIIYYALYYVENVVMISLWFAHTEEMHWFREPAMAAVIGGFWVGILCFMLPYYRFLHPDKGLWVSQWRRKQTYVVTADKMEESRGRHKWLRCVLEFCLG